MKALNVAVIGGGIGGLAAARACALAGAAVTLFEQAPALTEVGAGLQVSPNGFAVLRALGLGDALRRVGMRGAAIQLRSHLGAPVVRLDLGLSGHRDYWFVHRADLIELLANGAAAAGVTLRLGAEITDIRPGPVLRLGGGEHKADLVIGADGLHSIARRSLNGTIAPFFTRQVAWRATVPWSGAAEPVAQVHMGPHRHVVSYPLRGGALMNLVAVEERAAWAAESWSHEGDADDLRARFTEFRGPVRDLLAQVRDVRQWGLFRHPVAPVWGRDGTVLLGDAAHPTLPFLAQGANMALEDAWVLAGCLTQAGDIDTAIAAYQARREARVRRVVEAANRNAWKYHIAFPPLRMAAHMAMRMAGRNAPRRVIGQFDWLYSHDVTREIAR